MSTSSSVTSVIWRPRPRHSNHCMGLQLALHLADGFALGNSVPHLAFVCFHGSFPSPQAPVPTATTAGKKCCITMCCARLEIRFQKVAALDLLYLIGLPVQQYLSITKLSTISFPFQPLLYLPLYLVTNFIKEFMFQCLFCCPT